MKKIGFLVSGNGGTLKFIYLVQKILALPYEVSFVIGDRECGAIEFAKEHHIANHLVGYHQDANTDLIEALKAYNEVDLIITNIHKIIDPTTLRVFGNKFINLHYSLLPSYAGLIGMKTVELAKADNVQFIGATCHEVDETLDGGVVLCQSCFPVDWNSEFGDICHSVFMSANYCLLNSILRILGIEQKNVSVKTANTIVYNPALCFQTNLLDDEFWMEVAK